MITGITGKTRLIGLIGNPVEHSISPQLHNTLCDYFKLNLVYVPFCVQPQDLSKVVKAFKAIGMVGFNVTIPHKVEVMKLLDEVTQDAGIIGAVNTVKIEDGKCFGFNTDGDGFLRSLRDAEIDAKDKRVLMLGAGGAARSVAVKLARAGVKKIVLLNRSRDKAEEIARLINIKFKNIAVPDEMSEDKIAVHSAESDIIINTTPVGMWPDIDRSPINSNDIFKNKPVVCDLIYNPVKTKLLVMAEECSCKTLNGLGMLIYQGIAAFELWNEVKVPDFLAKELIKKFSEYFLSNEGI